MPDPNNPLETALRRLKDFLQLSPKQLMVVRAELINFRNLELENTHD